MRIVLFLFLFTFSVSTAVAQGQEAASHPEQKVKATTFPIVEVDQSTLRLTQANAVTGIFVIKNSRVKRALSFKVTTRNPKLA